MPDAIKLTIKGIKCDAPSCDYRDDDAVFDADKYLNSPCPKCGASLLTQEDYDAIKLWQGVALIVNTLYKPPANAEYAKVSVKMDGTGKMLIEFPGDEKS